MIFGGFNLEGSGVNDKKIKEIAAFMSWPNAKMHWVNFFNFYGGFILNPNLPYLPEDFFFKHPTQEILVLMSGNIYNRDEIISEIKEEREITSPELVAKLFLKEGPDFAKLLNGDFAIVLYLPAFNEVFFLRDHLGIQPIVFTNQENNWYFSSDNLSLCRAFHFSGPIQMDPLISNFRGVDHLLTFNPKIEKIIPGNYYHFSKHGIQKHKYWFPEKIKINNDLVYEKVLNELEKLLENSIKIRFNRKYTAGAHLSGGLDSSIVAAIAREISQDQENFYGFSWSPEGKAPEGIQYDERDLVKETAIRNNILPEFSTIDTKDFIRFMNDFINNWGYFSEIKTIEIARLKNINLLFSGWGGDEFISKESSGIDSDLLFNLKIKPFFQKNPISKPRKLAQTLFYFIFLPALGILDYPMRKNFRQECQYFKKKHKTHFWPTIKRSFFYKSRRERHLNLINNYHLSERTERWAIMGYKKGIVYRYPLLDKRIIEYILQVPSHLMFRNGFSRIILRDIGKKWLPKDVILRVDQRDPVYIKNKLIFSEEISLLFINEVSKWRENPDLYFFDFDLLEKDIQLYRFDPKAKDFKRLFGNITFIKMLHEFTKTYRSLPEGYESDEPGEIHNLNTDAADTTDTRG